MNKLISITLILFFSVAVFSASKYDKALNYFKNKEYKKSLKILGEILDVKNDLKKDSNNYKIRFLAAHNHWKLGNKDNAIIHLSRCIDMQRTNADPYIDLAMLYNDYKEHFKALNFALKARDLKKTAMVYYTLGVTYLKLKNFWKSKVMFEKANSLDPEFYASYNGLGIALLHLKKYGEANTAFSVALAGNPESAEILNNLAISLEYASINKKVEKKKNLLKQALRNLSKALVYNEKLVEIKNNINRIKIRLSKFK